MRKIRLLLLAGTLATLCGGLLHTPVQAKEATPLEGVRFNMAESLVDNLMQGMGSGLYC